MLTFVLLLGFIALAVMLAWYLIAHDHGEKEPILALWGAAGFGLLGVVIAGFLESWLLPEDSVSLGVNHGNLLVVALSVGIIEEVCKFVPLALVIYKKRYFNEHTDGVIYFALAGIAFGLPENLLYTLQYGDKAGFARLFLTPLFHAAATGTAGYFLARIKLTGKPGWFAAFPLLAVALLHGLYDFGLLSGVVLYQGSALAVTLGLSIALFMLYLRAAGYDRALGLSVVGHNNFCRACGAPNPEHHLHCTRCGKNA